MSFPGMPGSGVGVTGDAAGMSNQEQAMVKTVRRCAGVKSTLKS